MKKKASSGDIIRSLNHKRLLREIKDQWTAIFQDPEIRKHFAKELAEGKTIQPEAVLVCLAHRLAAKLDPDFTSLDVTLEVQGAAEATVWHPAYGGREVRVGGMTALVGEATYPDGRVIKAFIKWVSHPFHQYSRSP